MSTDSRIWVVDDERSIRWVLEKALTLDLRHFEDSEFYDKLTRARREASTPPLGLVTKTFGLPPENPNFVGRRKELAGLRDKLLSASAGGVVVVARFGAPGSCAARRSSRLSGHQARPLRDFFHALSHVVFALVDMMMW